MESSSNNKKSQVSSSLPLGGVGGGSSVSSSLPLGGVGRGSVGEGRIILGIDPGTNVMGYGVLKVIGNKAEMVSMGVIDMRKMNDPYLKLGYIFKRVTGVIEEYLPDEMAIEAPFFGENVQSMLKLGRAQGVAIAAAIERDVPIHEYAPMKIKMALTGNGSASKEQVAGMLLRMLKLSKDEMPKFMDATDALAAAYCHFIQMGRPQSDGKHYGSWKDFVNKNQDRVVAPSNSPKGKAPSNSPKGED